MINAIIIDDEKAAIDVIEFYLKQTLFIHHVGSFTNPLNALQKVAEEKIDLIFLDIQMPEISGMDFIKAINGKSKVILTTAYSEFAVEGFELDVLDYLLKPISLPRFLKATQRAVNIIQPMQNSLSETSIDDDFILVKTEQKGKLLKIMLNEIDYIEGMKNYVSIVHQHQKTLALLNLKDLETRLPSKYFMRIHKSYIVSLAAIRMIEQDEVFLKDYKENIYVGESYKKQLMETFKNKMI
ncbi:MAG: DNA-binding response regulator [Pseudopedobacter saltans]|uniref:DNA-binding response regulator n=1 Tax=Pseudopedobacter saltans TaxID=151895 RepID=A0A2W5ERA9_9SPHI|nr:MAG: DNA-binding response regulator [Pseudopedobacter saltans]